MIFLETFKQFMRHRAAFVGLIVLFIISAIAAMADFLPLKNPLSMDIMNSYHPPSSKFLLGSDSFGRDIFSRVIYGCRVSLRVGFLVAIITTVTGTTVGLVSGFYKVLDNIIMRIMDAMMGLPAILLALGIVAVLTPSEKAAIIALSVAYAPRTARIIRGSVLSLREEIFVEASKAVGASDLRIILVVLLPNVLAPLLVQETFIFAYSILSEAGLSFLGAGAPPPTPSLGNILSDARPALRSAPWIALFPGFMIMILVMSANLIGDGLRDVFDPKLKTEE